MTVRHPANPGHKRRKCSDYGDKSGQKNSFSAVLFIKFFGSGKMFFFNQRDSLHFKNSRPDNFTYPVIDRVSDNCSSGKDDIKKKNIHCPRCRKGSCCKKQGITRQKRCEYNTGFQKQNKKEQNIS